MASMPDKRGLPATLLVLLLAGMLGACDGGLFGTDDGGDAGPAAPIASAPPTAENGLSEMQEPPAAGGLDAGASNDDGPDTNASNGAGVEADATDSTETGVETDADTGPAPDPDPDPDPDTSGDNSEPAGDFGATSVGVQGSPIDTGAIEGPALAEITAPLFDNTQITTPRNDALLTVVNPREIEVLLITGGLNEAQANEVPIPANTASSHLKLPVGTSFVQLRDGPAGNGEAAPFMLDLNLGTGSVTTLVARDSAGGLDAVPLSTESGSSDVTLSKVRVLQSSELGDPQRVADLLLESRGPGGGGVEAEFTGISFDAPDSGYREVPAGDYTLIDSADRFAPQDVSFEGGQAYTVVIRALSGTVLQLEVDSDLDVR